MLAGLAYGEHSRRTYQDGEGRGFTDLVVGLSYWQARTSYLPGRRKHRECTYLQTRPRVVVCAADYAPGRAEGRSPSAGSLRVSLRNNIFSFSFFLRGTGEPHESRLDRLLLTRFTAQINDGNGVVIAAFGQPG
jgi:hypothetical protein